jgi:hypothetical protein
MEIDKFKDADTHKGYFCYNYDYFIKHEHCMIVTDEGQDLDGNILVRYFIMLCALYGHRMKRR